MDYLLILGAVALVGLAILVLVVVIKSLIRNLSNATGEVDGWGVIDSIKKTSFKKGDVLVLTTEANLSMAQASRIREDISRSIPEGVKTVLLEGGLQLSVLSKGEGD